MRVLNEAVLPLCFVHREAGPPGPLGSFGETEQQLSLCCCDTMHFPAGFGRNSRVWCPDSSVLSSHCNEVSRCGSEAGATCCSPPTPTGVTSATDSLLTEPSCMSVRLHLSLPPGGCCCPARHSQGCILRVPGPEEGASYHLFAPSPLSFSCNRLSPKYALCVSVCMCVCVACICKFTGLASPE